MKQLLLAMRSAVLCRADTAKSNCSQGNWQLSAAAWLSAERTAAEIKAQLNDLHMTAAQSEILECSNNVLMGRNDTSNTVKAAAVPSNTFRCAVYMSVPRANIFESYEVIFSLIKWRRRNKRLAIPKCTSKVMQWNCALASHLCGAPSVYPYLKAVV